MCPACVASAVLMAGGLMTTGGLAALLIKISRSRLSGGTASPTIERKRRNEHGDSNHCESGSKGCPES